MSDQVVEAEQKALFEQVQVRYDGLDAEKHEIDLYEFGKSAQGIAKIIATVADFSLTGNFQPNKKDLCCKVSVKETKANCFSFMAIIEHIDKSPTLTLFAGTVSATIFTGSLAYVWACITNKKAEMKALENTLSKAIEELGRKDETTKLLATLEKMALALIPAAKQAVSPIGNTCDTLKFGENGSYYATIDKEDKAEIHGEKFTVTNETQYRVLIDEFDMRKKTCKVALRDDLQTRYSAKITDPQAELANNKYALAMAKKAIVTIKAKTKEYENITKEFVISDIEYDNA
jgi:hypothetical protein